MKFEPLFLTAMLLTPMGAMADVYHHQRGYTTQRSCYKEIYKEEYVAGNRFSKGYVNSYTEKVEVPCTSLSWPSVRHHHHRYDSPTHRHNRPNRNQVLVTRSDRTSGESCSSSNTTTGGLLGGGLAAALSKKDAYGWSIPLGAVLGMGIANADC